MKKLVTLAVLALVSCGPTVSQSPEKQAVADDIHQRIMNAWPAYRNNSGIKVLAACFRWENGEAAQVSGLISYYFETDASRTRPVRELRISALGDCETDADRSRGDCTCQIADENGRNAIEVP